MEELNERTEDLLKKIFERSESQNLARFFEMPGPTGVLSYIDYTYEDKPLPVSETFSGSLKDENLPKVNLKAFTQFIEVQSFQVSASITMEQIQDLNKQFGIDVVSMVEDALFGEVSHSVNKEVMREIERLTKINYDKSLKWYHKLWSKLSKNWKKKTSVKSPENLQKLLVETRQKIFAKNRRSVPNFIIASPSMTSMIQDCQFFQAAPPDNMKGIASRADLLNVGSIAGMDVYVNNYITEDKIIIGAKSSDDGCPGVVLGYYPEGSSIMTIAEGTFAPKIAIRVRYAVVSSGSSPEDFYEEIHFDLKPSLWNRILGAFRNRRSNIPADLSYPINS